MDDAARYRKLKLELIAVGIALGSKTKLDPAVFSTEIKQIVVGMMDETKPTTEYLELYLRVDRKDGAGTKREGMVNGILDEIKRLDRNLELKRKALMMAFGDVNSNVLEKLAETMKAPE